MAPSADDQKVSLDARGVLIMVVAFGAIIGLWVNEFMPSESNYPEGFVYQAPKRGGGGSRAVAPEPPRPVLLTVEDCGKLAQEAIREYVERHPIDRGDDSAEEHPASRRDEDEPTSEEEPAVLEEYRQRAKEEAAARAASEEDHDEEPLKRDVAGESEEVKPKPKKTKTTKKTAKKAKKTAA